MQQLSGFRRRAILNDLGWLARHAAAAVATDDPTIVVELLEWQVAQLAPQGIPAAAVLEGCLYLADALEPSAPLAAGMLRSSAGAARDRHSPA